MRSLFLCYLLASVVLHLLVLVLPISVTMGGLGTSGMLPVRVHLLAGDAASPEARPAKQASLAETNPVPVPHEASASAPLSHSQSTAKESERSGDSAGAKSTREEVRPPLPAKLTASKPKTTNRSMVAARSDETPANKGAATLPENANSDRIPKTRPKKQAVLRTTAVYPGSRSAASSQKSAKDGPGTANSKASPEPAPTGSEQRGGSKQAPAGRFSRVRYARVVKPNYPAEARANGWEGTTVLKVLVGHAGKSEQVALHRSSGFNLLDDAAVKALWLWEFHPARLGRQAVQSWVNVPIVFKLEEDN